MLAANLVARERLRSARAVLKAALLIAHVLSSGIVSVLIVLGFLFVFTPDGSNNNGGGTLVGLLTTSVCAVQFVLLLPAVAANRISRWWFAAHCVLFVSSIILIICAAQFETGSADRS